MVISTYDKLRKEFDIKVARLQKECPHKHLSEWCDLWWALGHSTGKQVKVCLNCNKHVKIRKLL